MSQAIIVNGQNICQPSCSSTSSSTLYNQAVKAIQCVEQINDDPSFVWIDYRVVQNYINLYGYNYLIVFNMFGVCYNFSTSNTIYTTNETIYNYLGVVFNNCNDCIVFSSSSSSSSVSSSSSSSWSSHSISSSSSSSSLSSSSFSNSSSSFSSSSFSSSSSSFSSSSSSLSSSSSSSSSISSSFSSSSSSSIILFYVANLCPGQIGADPVFIYREYVVPGEVVSTDNICYTVTSELVYYGLPTLFPVKFYDSCAACMSSSSSSSSSNSSSSSSSLSSSSSSSSLSSSSSSSSSSSISSSSSSSSNSSSSSSFSSSSSSLSLSSSSSSSSLSSSSNSFSSSSSSSSLSSSSSSSSSLSSSSSSSSLSSSSSSSGGAYTCGCCNATITISVGGCTGAGTPDNTTWTFNSCSCSPTCGYTRATGPSGANLTCGPSAPPAFWHFNLADGLIATWNGCPSGAGTITSNPNGCTSVMAS